MCDQSSDWLHLAQRMCKQERGAISFIGPVIMRLGPEHRQLEATCVDGKLSSMYLNIVGEDGYFIPRTTHVYRGQHEPRAGAVSSYYVCEDRPSEEKRRMAVK